VRADATITFIGAKRGLYTAAAPDYTGAVFADALDVPDESREDIGATVRALDADWVRTRLPRRRPTAHKGDCGRVLIVGGDHGFAGAARLAGEAALRAGAGLVTVATRPQHAAVMASARPELMTRAVDDPARDLPQWLGEADVVVAGPGLGRGDWGRAALTAVLAQTGQRRLLDADALNLLAAAPATLGADTVLTPHPGEAGRLGGVSTADIQADRFAALEDLVERYDATVLLKGPGSLIGAPGADIRMIAGAQPALAVGGMGDVLSGVIGALLGQGLRSDEAAACGAWLHAMAAARCVQVSGTNGVLPSDLMPMLATVGRGDGLG
jgi:NAD(P)H-hydrate epimerase